MKFSLIQMDIAYGQPEKNRKQVEDHLGRVVEQHRPDVVVLPEMWNTGYDLQRLDEIADRGDLPGWMAEKAKEWGIVFVGGSIAEKRANGFYNTTYVYSPDGNEVVRYSKVHRFRLMDEEKYLQPGERRSPLFSIGEFAAGSMICYDLRFPELARSLALDGAHIVFVPAEWPHPRLNHWRALLQARAIENQMFIVAVNRVGKGGNHTFCGHSMVVDPWGSILAEMKEEEASLTVDIDLEEVDRVRRKIPVFKDRIPDCYF